MSDSEPVLDLEPRPDPYIGKVLAGRYKMIRLIGSGGMGAVYEAEHTLIGRRVAVKLLYSQLASDAQVVKRFVNEARAAATIGHPHILECTDIGQADDGSPFLVLELLEGHDLEKDFEDNGPMRIGRFVRIVRMACSALAVAHDKGIVHRDIKPENIFLSVQKGVPDHVKVLDFGISKFSDLKSTGPGTMSGSAMGTPYYMSPEQFRDASNVDARADIYAVGVILYQGFAGRLPFIADNLPGLALEIATGTPPPLEEIRPDLPVELVEVVRKTMSRDRDARFQTMRELDEALAAFVGIDAPVDVREFDSSSVAHMRTAAALNVAGAKHSQIRVKNEGASAKKTGSPVVAVGVVLALLGGGAGVYAMTRPSVAPQRPEVVAAPNVATAPVVETAPVVAPEPPAAAPQTFKLEITSNVEGATANFRGRTVALPVSEELVAGSAPELIEVNAAGRKSMRYAVTLDRARALYVALERGRGIQVASDSQLALALAGQPSASESRSSSGSNSAAASAGAATTAATVAPSNPPPARTRPSGGVYTGPSGDLPDL